MGYERSHRFGFDRDPFLCDDRLKDLAAYAAGVIGAYYDEKPSRQASGPSGPAPRGRLSALAA